MQDLAIDSQQPNSVRMRQRDEFTVISRTFRRDYFLVQAAMMFLCAFLQVPVQVRRNVLQSNGRHRGTVTVPFRLSTRGQR